MLIRRCRRAVLLLVLGMALAVVVPPTGAAAAAADQQVVATWGSLRYDLASDGNQRPTRVQDPELAGRTVTDVSEAGITGCAVASGQLFCAGNRAKELAGAGTGYSLQYLPVTAGGALAGRTVTRVSVGAGHSCAIASGAAVCWGDNTFGQLGAGRTSPEEQMPVPVDATGVLAGKRMTDIAVGQDSTCAVADGRAYCWGHDMFGELGRGSTAPGALVMDRSRLSARPVAVDTSGVLRGRTVSRIGVGGGFACALADGQVACWGIGPLLGDGSGDDVVGKPSPVLVGATGLLAGKTVTDLSVTQGRTCVVADAAPYCWGYNSNRSLGSGTTVSGVREPIAVISDGALAGRTVTRIVGGLNFACVLADGEVFCWGNNLDGAVGDGGGERNVPAPVAVDRTGPLGDGPVRAIFAGSDAYRMVSVSGGPEPVADIPATLPGDGRGSRSPVGNLDGGSLSGTSYQLEGWSLDPDAPGAVGTVHVWDYPQSGAARGVVATAGPSRPDIAAAFPGAGSGHGFWAQLRLAGPGRHRVCAFAIDAPGGTGGNTLLGCREVDVPGVAGSLDVVANAASGRISVLGWAADPDDPVRHQEIHVYVTGPAGQVGQPGIWTGHQRLDVARAFGWAGMRAGWQVDMPTQGTGPNEVCAFAIDRSEPKINQLLGCRTVDVRDPFGSLDAATIRGTSPGARLRVQAWGIDPNLPGQRTLVDFDIRQPDGTSVPNQSYLTGSLRPDVEAAFPGLGANSGILFETQVDQIGTYTVCASAVSPAGGHGRTQFGCQTFEVR